MSNYSKLIDLLKKKENINGNELAKRLGVSSIYISLIKLGKRNPSSTLLERMSYEFNIPVPILMWYTLSKENIKPDKQEKFKLLKPSIDKLINEFI